MSVEIIPCHLIHLVSSTPVLGMGGAEPPPAAWEWTGAVARDCILTACSPKSPHPVHVLRQERIQYACTSYAGRGYNIHTGPRL